MNLVPPEIRGEGRGRRPPPQAPGFSLLEVLVATALMGLVMVVLLQVLTASMRAQEASRGSTRALMAAEKALQEFCDTRVIAPGKYQEQQGRYTSLVTVTPQYEFTDPASGRKVNCYLIQARVSWREGENVKSLGLETIRTVAQKKS
jgi:prepilin-type N-terminal cleavage/methylation domain-containing protein